MIIYVLLISSVVDVLVYSQGRIAKKKSVQTRSDIAVANSVWVRSSTFKRAIIGMDFFCFVPVSLFVCTFKVYSNKNNNDLFGSLL